MNLSVPLSTHDTAINKFPSKFFRAAPDFLAKEDHIPIPS